MKTFDLTLAGYNANTSATDHLVKWINAPTLDAVVKFAARLNLQLHSAPYEMTYYPACEGNGVDVELDANGFPVRGEGDWYEAIKQFV